ncbi:interleukin-1 beta-like [Hyla sarda]|uniref:interleukin-1 beta-like n=1 Tax=Hyla sarda TaxID=327740 RepID=UPI0024C43330|nr:interleukin-1 beta-like [Hyla sarda]
MAVAAVPEINDISMEYSEHVEEFYSEDLSIQTKCNTKCVQWNHHEEHWSTYLSEIKPEIRKPRKQMSSFRKAIMLVVIIEKLKGKKRFENQFFFDDDDLLNHILVEEDITYNEIETQQASKSQFLYNKTTVHVIRDYKQKCLALQEVQGKAHLVALYLQGTNIEQEAKICVDTYITAKPDINKRPVTLGIAGRQLYLSCTIEEGEPVLHLREVADIKEKKNDDLLPYIFYKQRGNNKYNSFESAAFPGYYISTSQEVSQKVQIKPQDDQIFLHEFLINPNF